MKTNRFFGLLMAAALLAPASVAAQDVAPRGWIGISFRVVATGSASGVQTVVVIDEVNDGSPAQQAGLRAGDHLVRIEHVAGPDSLMNLTEYLHVAPGDRVQMAVMRDGRVHELTLHAADGSRRPAPSRTFTLTFQPDSMVESFSRAMDSLRIRLIEQRGDVRVVTAPRSDGRARVVGPGSEFRVVGANAVDDTRDVEWDYTSSWTTDVQAPFAFGLFRSERHDSLINEMQQLNRVMRELRAREAERLRDLMRESGGTLARVDQNDRVLSQVRGSLTELMTESRRLRKAMDNATRESAGSAYVLTPGSPPEVADVRDARAEFRPLAPYLLGENRAAGAEVRDLDPAFAEALGVDGSGVLVLDVPDGTPAAVAGIRAGDVITRIDQVMVRSVDDLRLGLSRAGAETPVTLIRQGTSRQVLLRR